ncbi:hypothetical protein LY78DRAFT_198124 [Colletotrichum sublineola]|nr:hypothetical protein LY78DRAFT_198124 [Colletotrichum sublineola]
MLDRLASREVRRICARWGIPFSDTMLKFTKPFGSFIFKSEREEHIYNNNRPVGIFKTVELNSSILKDAPYHCLLTLEEKEQIERTLCRRYLGCWKDKVDQLRATLSEKVWFGFDLDDTLHEFRLASSAATHRTLEVISQKHGTSLDVLKKEYSDILRIKTSNAFSDGKTSFDYRRERFTLLFERISQTISATFLAHLLETYETTLVNSLQLKYGSLSVLKTLKRLGKKIVIITEGPQDAQERTIHHVGIAEQIDTLVNNEFLRYIQG